MSYTQAFTGCWSHQERGFNHNCLACLIHTVGKLCEMLDEKEREQNAPPVHTSTIPEPTDVYEYTIGAYIVESTWLMANSELNECIKFYEKECAPFEYIIPTGKWRIRRMTDPKWEKPL